MNDDSCDLRSKACVPCRSGTPPLTAERIAALAALVPEWAVSEDAKLVREFRFRDFKEALAFVNRVGDLAEAEDHHPDILLHRWKRVMLTLTTHAINGLSENDFIVAAKIDAM